MFRLDQKLANIRAGRYKRGDFILADAKDGDMGPSLTSSGPHRQPDGTWTRYRSRAEFLDQIAAIVKQDIVDIMLTSASNLELLNERARAAIEIGKLKRNTDMPIYEPDREKIDVVANSFVDLAEQLGA